MITRGTFQLTYCYLYILRDIMQEVTIFWQWNRRIKLIVLIYIAIFCLYFFFSVLIATTF